jgi:hypothetical protein
MRRRGPGMESGSGNDGVLFGDERAITLDIEAMRTI